ALETFEAKVDRLLARPTALRPGDDDDGFRVELGHAFHVGQKRLDAVARVGRLGAQHIGQDRVRLGDAVGGLQPAAIHQIPGALPADLLHLVAPDADALAPRPGIGFDVFLEGRAYGGDFADRDFPHARSLAHDFDPPPVEVAGLAPCRAPRRLRYWSIPTASSSARPVTMRW